jgi:hypothetical protein
MSQKLCGSEIFFGESLDNVMGTTQDRVFGWFTASSLIYSCGLRLQEGTHLQVADLDSYWMMVHLRDGN